MSTSSPHSTDPQEPLSAAHRSWDVGSISQALDCAPALLHHADFGQGLRYRLGERDALVVELFPPTSGRRAGIVRLATTDLDLMLFRQPMPAIAEDGLLFRTAEHVLVLTAWGEVSLFRAVAA